MAYVKQTWACGDTITAEKLNHMEDGIGGGIETNISNPTDGQTLKYDAASGKWVNAEGGSGSSTLLVTATETIDGITMDHTWQEIHDAFPNVEIVKDSDGVLTRLFMTQVSDSDGASFFAVAVNDFANNTVLIFLTNSATGYPAASSGGSPIG